jgi:16S rRNA (adenine1518-N6/adenine1519-N6)-dimethyltransferase
MTPAHTRARKRFGQHFLIRPEVTERILSLGELRGSQSVLEIGPGRGALTEQLRSRCPRLVVVEIDRDLVADLRARLGNDPVVRIVEGDVLQLDFDRELAADAPYTVVANLPYNISTPLLMKLTERPDLFRRMVLMLQREVAERICAEPGGKDYGALSVAVQLAAQARIAFGVPPAAFRPPPKVESAVIVVEPFDPSPLDTADRMAVRRLTRSLFSQRRKQLGNLLRRISDDAAEILDELAIDPNRRPETLRPDDFVRLARAIESRAAARATPAVGNETARET